MHLGETRDVRSLLPRERSLLSLVVRLGPVEGFVQRGFVARVRGETVRGSPARSLQRARRASRGVARRLGLFPRRELRAKRLDLPALLDQLLGHRADVRRRRALFRPRRRPRVRAGAEREFPALSLRYAAVQPLEHRQARVRQARVVPLAGKVRVQRRARRDVGFGYSPGMGVWIWIWISSGFRGIGRTALGRDVLHALAGVGHARHDVADERGGRGPPRRRGRVRSERRRGLGHLLDGHPHAALVGTRARPTRPPTPTRALGRAPSGGGPRRRDGGALGRGRREVVRRVVVHELRRRPPRELLEQGVNLGRGDVRRTRADERAPRRAARDRGGGGRGRAELGEEVRFGSQREALDPPAGGEQPIVHREPPTRGSNWVARRWFTR